MMIPTTAEDRRPNDEPYWTMKNCPNCQTKLVYFKDEDEETWFDEFKCPQCDSGIYLDWPQNWLQSFCSRLASFLKGNWSAFWQDSWLDLSAHDFYLKFKYKNKTGGILHDSIRKEILGEIVNEEEK